MYETRDRRPPAHEPAVTEGEPDRHDGRSDRELLMALGADGVGALESLYRRHRDRVYASCYRMVGDAQVAEDLLQESFLRILRYSDTFKGDAAFTTWLYRLVRNVCLDHMKREARLDERSRSWALEHLREVGTREAEDPRTDLVRSALYELPPDRREVLVLSRYEGLSYAEIADVCGTTVGAIKVRAHRAMRELRARYQELEQPI